MSGCRVRRGTALAGVLDRYSCRPERVHPRRGQSHGRVRPPKVGTSSTAPREGGGTGTGNVDPSRSPRSTRGQSPEIVTMCSVAP